MKRDAESQRPGIALTGIGARKHTHFKPRWDKDGKLYIGSGRNAMLIRGATKVTHRWDGKTLVLHEYYIK